MAVLSTLGCSVLISCLRQSGRPCRNRRLLSLWPPASCFLCCEKAELLLVASRSPGFGFAPGIGTGPNGSQGLTILGDSGLVGTVHFTILLDANCEALVTRF